MAGEGHVPGRSEGNKMKQNHMGHQDQHHHHQDQHQEHHQAQRSQQSQAQSTQQSQAQSAQQNQAGQQIPGNRQAQAGQQINDGHQAQGFQPRNAYQQDQGFQHYRENLRSLSQNLQGDSPSFSMSPPAAAPPGLIWAKTHHEVVRELDAWGKALEAKKRLKDAEQELRKSTAAPPVLNQMRDEYLVNEMQKLRSTIRNFAADYFGGPPRDMDPDQLEATEWREEIAAILPDTDWILKYIMSNEKCPSIAQALLWDALQICVFGRFIWAREMGGSFRALERSLAPDPDIPSTSDSIKKYYKWRAETINLIFASMTGNDGQPIPSEALESWKSDCIEYMRCLIDPFLRKSDRTDSSYVNDLNQILDQALALDKDMSVQASPVVLFKQDVKPFLQFQQDEMELEHGETIYTAEQQVLLVVSPAMKRRGRSSGEGFDQERVLLPMTASCSPGTQHSMTMATRN
ncbi:hypothetical protein RB593_007344 [Gaeumannomyces tritici]